MDRLSLSFPLDWYASDPSCWTSSRKSMPGTPEETWALGTSVKAGRVGDDGGQASVFVGATEIAGRLWGKVECNPARMGDPDGCSLAPFGSLEGFAYAALEAATGVVRPACEAGDALLKRVDVARDFRGVADPSLYVRGLLPVKRPHARRTFVYYDPSNGGAETLWAGSNTGGARLYDQHEAYAEKGADPGSVRAEIEARADWARRYGMRTLDDVTTERLEDLLLDRWEWARFGTAVGSGPAVLRQLEALEVSPVRRQRLLGMLFEECLGGVPRVGKNQATEYRRMKDALGIVPSPDLLLDLAAARRLDFYTGTEVVGHAA